MAKKVSVTPLHDRVIVKADAAEEKSSGGIIIPDTAKEKPQRGTVVAAGPAFAGADRDLLAPLPDECAPCAVDPWPDDQGIPLI